MSEFKIKFRGVRGSYPITSSNVMKYGGNTACVEININGSLIILDAGTGIISLGDELMKEFIKSGTDNSNRKQMTATLLLSHFHYDHIQGLSFFKPNYVKSTDINIFGPQSLGNNVKEILDKSMIAPYAPVAFNEMSASFCTNDVHENDAIILHKKYGAPIIVKANDFNPEDYPSDIICIRALRSYAHPKDGVLVYRIEYKNKSLVYATDKECYVGGDSRLVNFARNADILIHDAQYTDDDYLSPISPKQGFGHSTPDMAIEIAKISNIKQLILFHIDPSYNDNLVTKTEEAAQKKFPNLMYAYEGLEIDLK